MNLEKKILDLRGGEIPKSFPTKKEMENLPKLSNGQFDTDKLEKETIGNMIFNCLSNYVIRDKKEGWYIDLIAQSLLDKGNGVEFKEKIKKFLIDVLDDQTMRMVMVKDEKGEEKEEQKGLYVAWAIVQVKRELGIKEEI